jgi:hypothetical protein
MCHLVWQPPVWDRVSNQKHRKSKKKNWARSVTKAWTGNPDETSQFDPNLTDDDIARMELECVEGQGQQLQDRCHKRTYFRKMDRRIGASAGEFTEYIFVEYLNSGLVHGWPITWDDLKKNKGAG